MKYKSMGLFEISYRHARDVFEQKQTIEHRYSTFVQWFTHEFGIEILDVQLHHFNEGDELDIWLIYEKDKLDLCANNSYFLEKSKADHIITKFNQILNDTYSEYTIVEKIIKGFSSIKAKYLNIYTLEFYEQCHVCEEMKKNIERLVVKFNCDALWTIAPEINGVSYFFYTDEQVSQYKDLPLINKWNEEYFKIIKSYDHLDFHKFHSFRFLLNSKNYFDTVMHGNWYEFYK